MEDSTKAISKLLGTEKAETAVHLYLYARYVAHYIYKMGKPVGLVHKPPPEKISPETEEMIEVLANKVMREVLSPETSTYHGKILPLDLACDLVRVEEDVELRDLEKVIPYKIARDIVMVNPQKIAVLDCACRLLQENPCEPLDVCMIVGDPMASFVVEHNVQGARWITSDEAARILQAEHEQGHVHTAYFKDVMEGRFYAICNCCSCCCLGMQAWTRFKVPIVAHSGFTARVNDDCTGCGDCVDMCPFDAIDVDDVAVVDEEKCMGCGVCEGACEFDAIRLEPDPARGEPLDIKKLISEKGE